MRHIYILIFFALARISFSQQVNLDKTNIALVLIDTYGQEIADDPKIEASMKIIDNGPGNMNNTVDVPNIYNGLVNIEFRGKFSQTLPQKPYGFTTINSSGADLNDSLFGFPVEHDWILLANYNDKSFVRNSLILQIFRQMGHYAPRTIHCEVIVNDDYQGIYVFTEKIKRDDGRVNISKMDFDDNAGDSLTGGYIFKVDYSEGDDFWTSSYTPDGYPEGSVKLIYTYPKPGDITSFQHDYLSNYVDGFENVLFGAGYKDPLSGYRKYININSFIDYFIIGEITRNVDAYKKSCFYYKKADSKGGLIYAGPVWDFDWAMKNFWECIYSNTDGSGWAYQIHQCFPEPVPPFWIPRMLTDEYFANKVNERYTYLRQNLLSESYLFNYIDSIKTLLDTAQERHYTRWPILGENVGTPEADDIPDSYAGEIEKLKNWLTLRLAWLDDNMVGRFGQSAIFEQISDANESINLYPNPVDDNLNIESTMVLNEIQIVSMDGTIIQNITTKEPNFSSINVSDLSPGLYIVKLYSKNQQVIIHKFVKK